MKEFFITILFVVVFMGGLFFVAALPFLIRDWVRRSKRNARQRQFRDAVESEKGDMEGPLFDFTVRLYKEDVIKAVSLEHRLQFPWYAKVVLTLLFGIWLVGGTSGIWKMIVGHEPHEFGNWIRCVLGVFIGASMLWRMWIRSWLMKKRIRTASEMEISQASEMDYLISPDGICVSIQGHQLGTSEWKEVDHVVAEADVLRIMFKSYDFICIPQDALFRTGDWNGLNQFLSPLMKKHSQY